MPRAATAWVEAVVGLGGRADVAESGAGELEKHYAEPHRRYHTIGHVEAVLRDSDELALGLGCDAFERAVLTLAACAHDVVYDARPGVDERASAHWASDRLIAAGLGAAVVRRVDGLIRLTAAHTGPAGDAVAAALLDADLAILGSEPAAYAGYVAGVRAEYSTVPAAQWRVGRAQVLRGLAERDPLYVTEAGRARWADAARGNLSRELASLTT